MRNNGYNHTNLRGCEKDWIKNAEYLRDKKARYLVGRHGIAYEVTGTITSDNQRIIDEKDIPRSKICCTQDVVDAFLYGEIVAWKPIEDIYINIDRVIEETQKSIIEFMSRYGIEPNTILMSEDKLKIVTDYVTSPTSEIVRLMGYPVKLIAGREIIKAALL